ncbi:MAG: ABC transporter transmembrane domain-containing protein, partial [Peptostreptococcaceae bacterium]
MKLLFEYALKYKWQFITRVITKTFVVLSVLAFDFMMGIIIDIFASGQSEKFLNIILITVSLIILMFVTEYIDGLVMSKYIKNTLNNLRCDIFSKIIQKDIKDFSLDNSGKYISVLYNDVKLIEDNFLNNIFLVISSITSFIISLIALSYISPYIVIFIAVIGILGFVIPNALSKKLIIEKNQYSKDLEDITSVTKDLFTGFEVIKGFNITNKINNIFLDSSIKVEETKRKYSVLEAIIRGFSVSFGISIYLGVLILGGYLMYNGKITVGTAIIIIQLSTHIVSPVKTSITLINQIKSVSLIAKKIEDILNTSNEDIENEELKSFDNIIEVENLDYS